MDVAEAREMSRLEAQRVKKEVAAREASALAEEKRKAGCGEEPEPQSDEEERSIWDMCETFTKVCETDDEGSTEETKGAVAASLAEILALFSRLVDDTVTLHVRRLPIIAMAYMRQGGVRRSDGTALARRSEEVDDDVELFSGEDGIELTMAAAVRHAADPEMLALAWRVLTRVCISGEIRRALTAAGGYESLVDGLKAHTEAAVQVALLKASARLCQKDEASKVQLSMRGLTDHVLALFEARADEAAVLEAGLIALRVLLTDDDKEMMVQEQTFRSHFVAVLQEKDAMNMLFDLLDAAPPAAAKAEVFRCITLMCIHKDICQEAVDNGVVDMALAALKDDDEASPAVARNVIQLLRAVAMTNEEGKALLLGEDASALMLTAAKVHAASPRVLEVALITILTLSFKDEGKGQELMENGLVPTILAALRAHPAEKLLFRSGCMLLRELCRTIEQRQQLLQAEIDEVVQAGMDAHPALAEPPSLPSTYCAT